jgi:hypothetical protein
MMSFLTQLCLKEILLHMAQQTISNSCFSSLPEMKELLQVISAAGGISRSTLHSFRKLISRKWLHPRGIISPFQLSLLRNNLGRMTEGESSVPFPLTSELQENSSGGLGSQETVSRGSAQLS